MKFYTILARYYDKIYHYVDYSWESKFMTTLIEKYNTSGSKKILDIACGTGSHADLLQKAGFEVTGLDINNEMLLQAIKKNPNINLIKGDMKKLSFSERFGTIICFFNSILYNTSLSELKKTLSKFHVYLESGGILIFDAVDKSIGTGTEKTKKFDYEEEGLRISFRPQWTYNEGKQILDLDIDFEINGEELHDHHELGAFDFHEIENILKEIGFEVFILEKKFGAIKKFNSANKEAIFVCRKPK